MSGIFNKKDGYVIAKTLLDPLVTVQEVHIFDEQCQKDVVNIELELKQLKRIKKMCFINILTSPIEIICLLFLFSKRFAFIKFKHAIMSFKFIFNKISIHEFSKIQEETLKELLS